MNTFALAWWPSQRILYHEPGSNFNFLDPNTGERQPLLRDSSVGWIFQPVFSPDGSRLAVLWNNVRQGPGLWIIPVANPADARMISACAATRRGVVEQDIDASTLRGQEVKLVAHVRTNVTGADNQGDCALRVVRPNGLTGFVGNMENRPIRSLSWTEVEIAAKVDADAERLVIGCALRGTGEMSVDAVRLVRKTGAGQWESITVQNPSFEESDPQMKPVGWSTPLGGYVFTVTDASPYQGKRFLSINSAHVAGEYAPIGWSRDGNYVYAHTLNLRTDARTFVTLRADGGGVKPLLDLSLEADSSVAAAVISPDGQRIVYSNRQSEADAWIVDNFDSN